MKARENLVEIIQLAWEESERGWGVRSDGHSIHKTFGDCDKFVKEYWAKMPDAVPDEYSRPSGEPYTARIEKKSELYKKLLKSKNGIWISKYDLSAR